MSNVDSLLDLGDDTEPLASELKGSDDPPPGFDPFDPFATPADGQVKPDSSGGGAFDEFDPFGGLSPASQPSMSSSLSSRDQKSLEDQFDDLLGGDFSSTGVQNGDVITTSSTTVVEEEGGMTTTETITEQTGSLTKTKTTTVTTTSSQDKEEQHVSSHAADGDKKALDYMKARYEADKQNQDPNRMPKVHREPKKLDMKWEKPLEEDSKSSTPDPGVVHSLEQDRLKSRTLGVDYSKSQYQSRVEGGGTPTTPEARSPGADSKRRDLIPVNRQVVEKVAPPEITKNVRKLFETGEVSKREIKKMSLAKEFNVPPESGTFENEPEQKGDVIRESDKLMNDQEVLAEGHTTKLLEQWVNVDKYKKTVERAPIRIAEDEGHVLENEPRIREDVARESDKSNVTEGVPTEGQARELLHQWKTINERPANIKKTEINLKEGGDVAIVLESEPVVRPDVIRESDNNVDVQVAYGKTQNLKGYWATRSDDVEIAKEAVVIDRESGAIIRENEPIRRQDVIRETDILPDQKVPPVTEGHALTVAERFLNSNDTGPRTPREPINIDRENGPMVVENQPIVLDNVVKHTDTLQDVKYQEGFTSNMASAFVNRKDEWANRQREEIEIDRSGPCILENDPEELPPGVVRSDAMSHQVETVEVSTGSTRNRIQGWVSKEQDSVSVKTSAMFADGKPRWISEIESAKDGGVYENDPEAPPENVLREGMTYEEPQELIPEKKAKSLRQMWDNREAELEAEKERRRAGEALVRFTPPREMTPPALRKKKKVPTATRR